MQFKEKLMNTDKVMNTDKAMKLLITGTTGFIGSHLLQHLSQQHEVTTLGRSKSERWFGKHIDLDLKDLSSKMLSLSDFDAIIHSAARAHVMNDSSSDPIEEYRRVNTYPTLELATQAAEQGVKRFIFISSIKVNGESTTVSTPFCAQDKIAPTDPYAQSKAEAEQKLNELALKTNMEIVIIRSPLVYGPGVKANISSLMGFVKRGVPLPFACIKNNKRSIISIQNLVDLITICTTRPSIGNKTFLASDGIDISTSDMVHLMRVSLGYKYKWQLPVPVWMFKIAGKIFGKMDMVERLTGSLRVDISETKAILNWAPPLSIEDGFKAMAESLENETTEE